MGDGPGLVVVDDSSWKRLGEARALGRGVVIAASHTGNWDACACAIAEAMELVVVTKHLRVGSLDRFWQRTRTRRGVRLLDARGALREARRALGRGACVAMMIDQVPERRAHAVVAPFLGGDAYVDRAPAALAAAAGAPLVVAAAFRDGSRQRLSVIAVELAPARGKSAWIAAATVRATGALDAFVRAHPADWLWLHRRFRAPPP